MAGRGDLGAVEQFHSDVSGPASVGDRGDVRPTDSERPVESGRTEASDPASDDIPTRSGGFGGDVAGAQDPFEGLPFPHPWTIEQDLGHLTTSELGELRNYAIGGYKAVNDALRGHGPMTDDIAERIELLKSALSKYPLKRAYRVSRSAEASDLGIDVPQIGEDLIGDEFTEYAFMSTSGHKNPPYLFKRTDPVVLDIVVPEATPGIAFDEHITRDEMVQTERELLLIAPSRMVCIGVRYDDDQALWRLEMLVRRRESEGGVS